MTKDKIFETINRFIQESYKDHPNTEILHDVKISEGDNDERQIDLLIKVKVNSIDIQIAIECKDWNIKIPVKEMEAFILKCQRLPKIDRKIFISKKGFQSGAITAAKEYNVDLYTLSEISSDKIKKWVEIESFNHIISHRKINNVRYCADYFGNFEPPTKVPLIFLPNQTEGIPIKDFIVDYVTNKIPGKILLCTEKNLEELTLQFCIKLKVAFYVIEDKIYKLRHIHYDLEHKFERKNGNVHLNIYKDKNEKELLETATLISEDGNITALAKKTNSNMMEILEQRDNEIVVLDKIDLSKQNEKLTVTIKENAIVVLDKLKEKS